MRPAKRFPARVSSRRRRLRVERLEDRRLLSIEGVVWEDLDGDGQRDPGEPGHAGVAVYLDLDRSGTLSAGDQTTVTAADGSYTFAGLAAGDYAVAEIVPSGYEQTFPLSDPTDVVGAERVASGLSQPLYVTSPPGDTERLFILEKATGRIEILNLDDSTINPTPFLTITDLSTSSEQGLLGLAFDPDYAANGHFYVSYTNASGTAVKSRFSVSADPDVADAGSEHVLLTIPQPQANHNGGWLGFGPDGYLYISSGDGGGGGNDDDAGHTPGAFQPDYGGGGTGPFDGDAFVARLGADGTSLVYGTYLGGSGADVVTHNQGIAVTAGGEAVMTGETESTDFPLSPGAYQATITGGKDGFVAKLSADGGSLLGATLVGGSLNEQMSGIGVAADGTVFVSGNSPSTDYPTTPDAFQPDYAGGDTDVLFSAFSSDLAELTYSTYLGGSGSGSWGERGRSVWTGPDGSVLISGDTNSADFPVSAGVFQETYGGGDKDGFLARFAANPAGQFLGSAAAQVVGRHVFYNNSARDGDPGASPADDLAMAPHPSVFDPADPTHPDRQPKELGKEALLPGGTATFANYTSYSRGLNGVMIDVVGLPGTPTESDFLLKVGNNLDPSTWADGPAPQEIAVRPGAGVDGSDRVTLIWADDDPYTPQPEPGSISKQWLQITVLDTAATGLAAPGVFYFGNAIGESGNSTLETNVDPNDEIGARTHTHSLLNPAPPEDPYDYDRDKKVDTNDEIIARNNSTSAFSRLVLLTAPSSAQAGAPAAGAALRESNSVRAGRGELHDAAFSNLDGEHEDVAEGTLHVPALPWLDGSDLASAQGRSSKIAPPDRAAVEKLLATL